MKKACKRTKDLFAYAEDNRPSIVYKAVNTITGDFYIGVTRWTLERRREKHILNAKKNDPRHGASKFYAALRKYGKDAFVFSIERSLSTYKEGLAAEVELIKTLSPTYNLTSGGEGVLGHRHNAESRRKMSASAKKRGPTFAKGEWPQELLEKIRVKRRERPSQKGKLSQERLAVIRRCARLGNAARRKAIICVTDGLQFESVTAAGKHYGIEPINVGNMARGKTSKMRRTDLQFAFLDAVEGKSV